MNAISSRLLIIILMFLALALTLPVINSFPIALDEPFTIFHAQQDLGDMKNLFVSENNPPLHFIILHFWIKLFGISIWSVRIMSLIFSILTIPVLFKLANKIVDKWGAISVVLLFVFSNFIHYHSIEARTYSLFVFLFTIILYCLYRIIFEHEKKAILLLSLVNIALLYTHYLAGFVIIVELIVLLYFYRELAKELWVRIAIGVGVMVLGYLPGLWLLIIRLNDVSDSGTWVPAPEYSELYGNILRFYNGKFSFVIIVGLISVLAIFAYFKTKKIPIKLLLKKEYQFVFLCFLIPYFGMFIISKSFEPIFLDRYLLYTIIPLFLSLIIIVSITFQRTIHPALTVVVVLPMILFFKIKPDTNREPDSLANWIKSNANNDKSILICPPFFDLTFVYHYDRSIFMHYKNFDENNRANSIYTIYSGNELVDIPLKDQVFLVDMDAKFLFPNNGIQSFLEMNYTLENSASFKGSAIVYQYSK